MGSQPAVTDSISTVTKYSNRYYCGANTSVTLRQYMSRSIDQRLQGNTQFLEAELDQAVAISYSVQQSKEALYSYADSEFSAVADGKVIVMGKLITNLSDYSPSNYIGSVIRSFENQIIKAEDRAPRIASPEIYETAHRLDEKVRSGADLSPQEAGWLSSFLFNFSDPTFQSVNYNPFIPGRYNTNIIYRNGRADQHNLGFDRIIKTMGGKDGPVESIILKDVSIRSIEQERSPTDQPIVEIYDFIARTVLYGMS